MDTEVVIFDMGGVLIQYNEAPGHAAVQAMCVDPQYAKSRIPHLAQWDRVHRGQVTFDDLFKLFVEQVGLETDYATFVLVAALGFGPPMPAISEVIDSLAGRFRFALLSNTNAVHWAYARTHYADLLDRVKPHFASFEIGMAKPDPEIFLHVAAELGVEPANCLFIDDLESNVDAARRVGFDAITFKTSGQLTAELRARRILE